MIKINVKLVSKNEKKIKIISACSFVNDAIFVHLIVASSIYDWSLPLET